MHRGSITVKVFVIRKRIWIMELPSKTLSNTTYTALGGKTEWGGKLVTVTLRSRKDRGHLLVQSIFVTNINSFTTPKTEVLLE